MTHLVWAPSVLALLFGFGEAGCAARSVPAGGSNAAHPTTPIAVSNGPEREVVGTALPPGGETPATAPLPGTGVVSLLVPGFDPALVSFPRAAAPQPVIVVAHGAKDLPDAQCRLWRAIAGERAVIVCLSGPRADVKEEPRYFPDHLVLEKILVATLLALRSTYPTAIDAGNAVYAGYSQGATMGALMIGAHAHDFPRLALVEGGFEQWTVSGAAAFKTGGGERVLFACGTRRCLEHATISARFLRAAGVEARVVSNLSEGHAYGIAMEKLVRDAFDWLVADDARYVAP